MMSLQATKAETNIFNHLGAGVEVGTTGIGFEFATPITDYLQLRAGMAILPSFTVKNIKVHLNADQQDWQHVQAVTGYTGSKPDDIRINGKATKADFKMLLDVFPFRGSTFHITAGFYAGKSQVLEAYTTNYGEAMQAVTEFNNDPAAVAQYGELGVEVGDYLLTPNGSQARGFVKVKGFKPYVGLGFGRGVPTKTRLSFAMDLGVQFWSTPEFYVQQKNGEVRLTKQDLGDKDGGFVKTVSKIKVYPCLNFRLTGCIF